MESTQLAAEQSQQSQLLSVHLCFETFNGTFCRTHVLGLYLTIAFSLFFMSDFAWSIEKRSWWCTITWVANCVLTKYRIYSGMVNLSSLLKTSTTDVVVDQVRVANLFNFMKAPEFGSGDYRFESCHSWLIFLLIWNTMKITCKSPTEVLYITMQHKDWLVVVSAS